ncbi:RNA polymerase sigma factor [Krasilnikovia sp. M28-CT-15]|uniref:RNA polymerase sigma factor n=1 Tax=Krasilnikovia sp. M28-CT-15 TaxID=3373540 RepID=UPI0038765123
MTQDITCAPAADGGEADPPDSRATEFERFYRDNIIRLITVATHMFGQDAQDLTHEAMATAFQNWHKLASRTPGERFNYVKQAIIWKGVRLQDREANLRPRLRKLLTPGEQEPVESRVISAEGALELLQHLPSRQRVALILTSEGYTAKEISKLTGVSPSTVRSQLQQGRATLGRLRRERGDERADA